VRPAGLFTTGNAGRVGSLKFNLRRQPLFAATSSTKTHRLDRARASKKMPMPAFVELTGKVAARRPAHSLMASASELSLSTCPCVGVDIIKFPPA